MSDDQLTHKLDAILVGLEEIRKRVDRLEGHDGPVAPPIRTPVPPPPPPPMPRPTQTQTQNQRSFAPRPPAAAPRPMAGPRVVMGGDPTPPRSSGLSTDEFIGKRVLPVVGAVLLLASLGVFAPIAYKSMGDSGAFMFELAVSFAFLVGGILLRNTREQFGEIVGGIGMGGLFVTAVAGDLYHRLYNGQIMVAACFLLSGATCYYGIARKSKVFVGIGLIGGMVSAWMPSTQDQIATAALLEAMVILAALPILATSKWKEAIVVLWPIAFLAASRFLGSDFPWAWRVAYVDGLSLGFALAYAYAYEDNIFDPQMSFSPVTLICGAVGSWLIKSGVDGSLHTVLYAATVMATGLALYQTPKKRITLQLTAAGIAAFLTPLGLSTDQAIWFFGGAALLLCAASIWRKQTVLLGFAAIEIGGGIYSLMALDDVHAVSIQGGGFLLLLGIAAIVGSFKALMDKGEEALGLGGLAGWVVVSRMAYGPWMPLGTAAGLSVAWSVWAFALLAAGFGFKIRSGRIWGYLILAVTLCKVIVSDLSYLEVPVRAALLFVLGLVMLGGGYIAIRSKSAADPVGQP